MRTLFPWALISAFTVQAIPLGEEAIQLAHFPLESSTPTHVFSRHKYALDSVAFSYSVINLGEEKESMVVKSWACILGWILYG